MFHARQKKRPGPRAVIQVAGGGPSAILFQTKFFNSMETGWNFDKVKAKPSQEVSCVLKKTCATLLYFSSKSETTFGFSCIIYTYMVMASLKKTKGKREEKSDISQEACI